MRWRIGEYFRFKKQQYAFEDFRVRSLNVIRVRHRILTLPTGLIGILSEKREESVFVMELIAAPKRIYRPKPQNANSCITPSPTVSLLFFDYALSALLLFLRSQKLGN